jgi:hypothetical protein
MHDSAPDSHSNRLSTIACPKFFHHVLEMNLHGVFRDVQHFGDVPIAVTFRNMSQYLKLTMGE